MRSEVAVAALVTAVSLSASGMVDDAIALLGVADALREATGRVWEPTQARMRSEAHDRLRTKVGDAIFAEIYEGGLTLERDSCLGLIRESLARLVSLTENDSVA